MKFVQINGPSCVGKSTVVKRILEEKQRYYKVSYDTLKWGFSQYNPEAHYQDVQQLVRALARAVCELGYNIVCDSGMHAKTREQLFAIAKNYEYEVIEINLEAEYEVLKSRFEKRLEDYKENPERRMANHSVDRHKELFDIYQAEKNPQARTFRTDLQNEDEIMREIVQII